MNKIYSQYNLDRLRLAQSQINTIKLERSEIKRGTGKNAIRKVFGIDESGKHEYDIYEHQQLDSYRKEFDDSPRIPNDETLLRFLYANHFDFLQTTKINIISGSQLTAILNGHSTQRRFWQDIRQFKKQGGVYISGRGQAYRPIIVVNADKLDTTLYPVEDIMRAISILLMVVKDYMLVPGKIENWFVIVEAKNTTAFSVPFTHLNQIFEMLKLNFPCYLERMFILQPQTSIQITWQIVEQFIPYNSRHKIEFVTNDYSLLYNYIKPKQLEQRHGGKAPNVYDYWPPHVDEFNEVDYMLKEQQENEKIKEQLDLLQKVMAYTSSINSQVSELLRKQYKPKNKIYKEETHLETQQYYSNKANSKTILLNAPKISQVLLPQEECHYQQETKPQEVNNAYNFDALNMANQQQSFYAQQSQQILLAPFPIQTRFVGSKNNLNESKGSSVQSRFVGVKTQHLLINRDVSIIQNREESIQHSQIMDQFNK